LIVATAEERLDNSLSAHIYARAFGHIVPQDALAEIGVSYLQGESAHSGVDCAAASVPHCRQMHAARQQMQKNPLRADFSDPALSKLPMSLVLIS